MILEISLLDAIRQGCNHELPETETEKADGSFSRPSDMGGMALQLPSPGRTAFTKEASVGESWRDCCSLANKTRKG